MRLMFASASLNMATTAGSRPREVAFLRSGTTDGSTSSTITLMTPFSEGEVVVPLTNPTLKEDAFFGLVTEESASSKVGLISSLAREGV